MRNAITYAMIVMAAAVVASVALGGDVEVFHGGLLGGILFAVCTLVARSDQSGRTQEDRKH